VGMLLKTRIFTNVPTTLQVVYPLRAPGGRECGGFVRLGPDGDDGVLMYAEGAGREKRAKTPRYRKPGGVANGTRTRSPENVNV